MESNAAAELLVILKEWNTKGGTGVLRQRNGEDSTAYNERFWATQQRAARLLFEVEEYSREIGDYDDDADMFKHLRWFVWAPNVDWASQSHVITIEPLVLSSLSKISRLMRGSPRAARITDAELVALRDAVEHCLDLLDVAPADVKEHGEHVAYLLRRCLDILDNESVDLVSLQNISFQAVASSFSNGELWEWDKSATFFQNVSVIALAWGPKIAFSASVSAGSHLLLDGSKAALQLAGSLAKGAIEAAK